MKNHKKKNKNRIKTNETRNNRDRDMTQQHDPSQLDNLIEKQLNSSLNSNKSWSNLSQLSQDYFDKIDSPTPSNRSLPLHKRLRSKKKLKSGINLSFCKSPLYGKSVSPAGKLKLTPKNIFKTSNLVNSNKNTADCLLKNKVENNCCDAFVHNVKIKDQQLQDDESDKFIPSKNQGPSSAKKPSSRSKEKEFNTVLNTKNQSSKLNEQIIGSKQVISATSSKKQDKTPTRKLRSSSKEKQTSSYVCKENVEVTLCKRSEGTPRKRLRSGSREKNISNLTDKEHAVTSNKNSKSTPTKRLRSSSQEKVNKDMASEENIKQTKKTRATPLKILRNNSNEKQIEPSVSLRKVKSRVELQEIDDKNTDTEEIIPPSQDVFDEHNSKDKTVIHKLSMIPESLSDYSEKSMEETPIKRLSLALSKKKVSSLQTTEVEINLDYIKSPDKFIENRDINVNFQRGNGFRDKQNKDKSNEDELMEKENLNIVVEVNKKISDSESSSNDSSLVSNFPKVSLSPRKKHKSINFSPSKEFHLTDKSPLKSNNKNFTDEDKEKSFSINLMAENKKIDSEGSYKIAGDKGLNTEICEKQISNEKKQSNPNNSQDTYNHSQTSHSLSSFYSCKSTKLKPSSRLYDSASYSSLSTNSFKDDKKDSKSADNCTENKSLNDSIFSHNESNKVIDDSIVNRLLEGLESPWSGSKNSSSVGDVGSKLHAESPERSVSTPELRRSARLSNMSSESPDKRKLDSSKINNSMSGEEKNAKVKKISSRPSTSPFKKVNSTENSRPLTDNVDEKKQISSIDELLNFSNSSTEDKIKEKENNTKFDIKINRNNGMKGKGNKTEMDRNVEDRQNSSDICTEEYHVQGSMPSTGQGVESEDSISGKDKSNMKLGKINDRRESGSPSKYHDFQITGRQSGKNNLVCDHKIDSMDSSDVGKEKKMHHRKISNSIFHPEKSDSLCDQNFNSKNRKSISKKGNSSTTKSDTPNTDPHSNKLGGRSCTSSLSDANCMDYSGEEVEANVGITPLRKSPRKRFKPTVERNFEKSPSARLTQDESTPDDTDIDKHYTPSSDGSDSSYRSPLKNKSNNKKSLTPNQSMRSSPELISEKSKLGTSFNNRSRSREIKKTRSSLKTSSDSLSNSNKNDTPVKNNGNCSIEFEANDHTSSDPAKSNSKLPSGSANSKESYSSSESSQPSMKGKSRYSFESNPLTSPFRAGDSAGTSESLISQQKKSKSKHNLTDTSDYSSSSSESFISRKTKTKPSLKSNQLTKSPQSPMNSSSSFSKSIPPNQYNFQSNLSSKIDDSFDSSLESNPESNLHHTSSYNKANKKIVSPSNQSKIDSIDVSGKTKSKVINNCNKVSSSNEEAKSKRSDTKMLAKECEEKEKLENKTTEKESGSEKETKSRKKKRYHKKAKRQIFIPPSQESSSETDTNDIPSQMFSDNTSPLSVITVGKHEIDVGLIIKQAIKALELPANVVKRISSLETELIYNSDKLYETIKKDGNLERLKTPVTEDEIKLIYNRWCDFCRLYHFDKKRPDYFFFNSVTKKFISNKFIKYFVTFLSQDLDRYISPQSLLNKFETIFRRKEELQNENKNVSNNLNDHEEAIILALEQRLGNDNVFKNYINPIAAHALNRTLNATRRARAVLHRKIKSKNKENKSTSETELNGQTDQGNTSRNRGSDFESSDQENHINVERSTLDESRLELRTINERIESMQEKSEIRIHLMNIMLDIIGETKESVDVLLKADLSVKDWRFAASQLKIPAHVAKAIFQTRIHPILFTERPINKYQLILDLICLFKERKYKEWNDIKWSELSDQFYNLKPLVLFTSLTDFIRDNVPEDRQANFNDCMKYIHKHKIRHLKEKIKMYVLLDVCK